MRKYTSSGRQNQYPIGPISRSRRVPSCGPVRCAIFACIKCAFLVMIHVEKGFIITREMGVATFLSQSVVEISEGLLVFVID
jgi:hypothetical protein